MASIKITANTCISCGCKLPLMRDERQLLCPLCSPSRYPKVMEPRLGFFHRILKYFSA